VGDEYYKKLLNHGKVVYYLSNSPRKYRFYAETDKISFHLPCANSGWEDVKNGWAGPSLNDEIRREH
jgi:hypothetical protein